MRIASFQVPIAALFLALFPACRTAAPVEIEVAPSSPTTSADSASHSLTPSPTDAPAQSPAHAASPAPARSETPAQAETPKPVAVHADAPPSATPQSNRDLHGPADLPQYIHNLESEARVRDLQVDVVLSKLALPDDAMVGDLGCGPGVFSMAFAKACPNGVVYACDVEPAQLDVIRQKIHTLHMDNVVPVLASTDNPHFPPGQLDVVFIADTYHHLDDRVTYMRRVARALKPGGRLVVLDYKSGLQKIGPPPEHKLAAGVMDKELVDAGWKLVQRFDTHPYHDFEVWRAVQPWEK